MKVYLTFCNSSAFFVEYFLKEGCFEIILENFFPSIIFKIIKIIKKYFIFINILT